jgi:hypothetical protein
MESRPFDVGRLFLWYFLQLKGCFAARVFCAKSVGGLEIRPENT